MLLLWWWYANVELWVTGEDVFFLDCSSAADGAAAAACTLREIRNIQTAIDAKNESI